jgi:hypothetical protein
MILVTVAVILLVTVAAGAPEETTLGIRVDSLGLCTAGLGHFSLALGIKLGAPGAFVPRAGLVAKLACLPAASTLATPPHCRHQKQDQQQHRGRGDDDYQGGVHLSSSPRYRGNTPAAGRRNGAGAPPFAVALFAVS